MKCFFPPDKKSTYFFHTHKKNSTLFHIFFFLLLKVFSLGLTYEKIMSFFQLFSFPLGSNITFSSSPTFLFHTWHFFSWKHFFTFLNQPTFFFSIMFFSVIPRFKCIYVFPENFFSHLFHPNVFSWFLTWHILIHTFFFLRHFFFSTQIHIWNIILKILEFLFVCFTRF